MRTRRKFALEYRSEAANLLIQTYSYPADQDLWTE